MPVCFPNLLVLWLDLMLRGCSANNLGQRLCSALSWAEVPYGRAIAKLKAARSSPPATAATVRGAWARPGSWHRSTFVVLLEVPFPAAAAKAMLRSSACPAGLCSEPAAAPGGTRHSTSCQELVGLPTFAVGGTWAQPACFCPDGDLHSVTVAMLSSPRLSQLWLYQLHLSSAKCREQANVF